MSSASTPTDPCKYNNYYSLDPCKYNNHYSLDPSKYNDNYLKMMIINY